MKTKIVLCPTLKFASYEWRRLIDTYPDVWVHISKRNPMSLTSKYGVKYLFYSENETDKLKGLRGDFISWHDIDPKESEECANMRLIDADKLKQDDELTRWLSVDAVRTGKMLKLFSELFVKKIDEQPTIEVTPHESVTEFADRCRECGARHKKESESGMKLEEFTDKIVTTVKEDSDRFIFETVGEWLSVERKMIIPKKVLLRSIECFKQEHKEEFDTLMEAYGNEE